MAEYPNDQVKFPDYFDHHYPARTSSRARSALKRIAHGSRDKPVIARLQKAHTRLLNNVLERIHATPTDFKKAGSGARAMGPINRRDYYEDAIQTYLDQDPQLHATLRKLALADAVLKIVRSDMTSIAVEFRSALNTLFPLAESDALKVLGLAPKRVFVGAAARQRRL